MMEKTEKIKFAFIVHPLDKIAPAALTSIGICSRRLVCTLAECHDIPVYAGKDCKRMMSHCRESLSFIFSTLREEACGIPPLKVMATEQPVVASWSGGIVETVEEGKTGIMVEPGDPDGLAEEILSLFQNDGLRMAFGKGGQPRLLEKFT